MSVIGSDGLSLLVGDGAPEENFNTLRGVTVTRLELTQKLAESTTIAADAWTIGVSISDRHAVIDCDLFATDEAPVVRLRNLAFSGDAGNFRLETDGSNTLVFQAFITQYKETIQAGEIKKISCQLQSSASIALA